MKRYFDPSTHHSPTITLNGKPLFDWVWVDEEQGQAMIFEHDKHGQRVWNSAGASDLRTLVVKGTIGITEPPSTAPTADQLLDWQRMYG